jgi:beta-glucanase (GH16 family)
MRLGMMPEKSVYGDWPRSGEIDIMESRGNARGYDEGGRNFYYGTLHWGKQASSSQHAEQ